MTNEELILQRLESIEARLADMPRRSPVMEGLLQEAAPVGNQAFRLLIEELECINGRVNLDDILDLLRTLILSVPNLNGLLGYVNSFASLWSCIAPAIAPTFPHIVEGMGKWEAEGLFAKLGACKDSAGNLLDQLSPENIAQVGQSLAFLLKILGRLSDPAVQANLTKLLDALQGIDLDKVQPAGPLALLRGLGDQDVKQAMGLLLALLKALGAGVK